MKGIALAIETIVYIILAITVLTVLLFFFTSTGGQAQNEFQLQQQRHQYCARYASIDASCDEDGYKDVQGYDTNQRTKNKEEVLKKIADACVKLKLYPQYCKNKDLADLPCVRACCIQCPTKPEGSS